MTRNNVTTKEIYELVGQTRTELLVEIKDLRADFNRLEEGRVSALEAKVADMNGRILATTGIIAFLVSVMISLIGFFIK